MSLDRLFLNVLLSARINYLGLPYLLPGNACLLKYFPQVIYAHLRSRISIFECLASLFQCESDLGFDGLWVTEV